MITEHALPKSLCRRGQPLRVLIVGAGGNGSAVLLGLPYLHQAMKVWGHAGGLHVMLADGDLVSETNCVRQPFASADVGLNKASRLDQPRQSLLGSEVAGAPGALSQGFAENQFGRSSPDYWLCRYTGGAAGHPVRCHPSE